MMKAFGVESPCLNVSEGQRWAGEDHHREVRQLKGGMEPLRRQIELQGKRACKEACKEQLRFRKWKRRNILDASFKDLS